MYKKNFVIFEGPSGLDEFPISQARYGLGEIGICVGGQPLEEFAYTFAIVTSEASHPLGDTKDSRPRCDIELNYYTGSQVKPKCFRSGDTVRIPSAYDSRIEYWVTNLYRTSHEGIDDIKIQILGITDGAIEVRIAGETEDMRSMKGNILRARLYIHADMYFDDDLGPTF